MTRNLSFFSICGGVLALAAAAGETILVADFETAAAETFSTDNGRIELDESGAAAGRRSLKAIPTVTGKKWRVKIPLPAGTLLAECAALQAAVRVTAGGEASLRWLAVDSKSKSVMYQRSFKLAPAATWQTLVWPLESWRWGTDLTGDWPRVDTLYLQVESVVSAVELDEVTLAKGARGRDSAALSEARVLELAFAKNEIRRHSDGELLVATDALRAFSDDDLAAILREIKAARAWLKEFFGAGYTPTNQGMPIALLIFSKKEGQTEFCARLGELWGVEIARAPVTGYTVTSLATVTHDPELGVKRPVFVHEALHALLSRDLRLPTGAQRVNWLQEGFANYLQVALYPESVQRAFYVRHFAQPIGANTFFKPLAKLVGERVSGENYLQLSSLLAYLVTEDPEALRALAKAFANADSAAAALKAARIELTDLEAKWFEWGRKKFAAGTEKDARAFDLPPGWKD